MKIILNPKYEHLRAYLTEIEDHFEHEGREIFRDRNVIRTLKVDDLVLVVKRYAPLSLRGQLANKFFRTPKGKKAYFHPLEMRERGFDSPEPVAFVKVKHGWKAMTTYFVSLQSALRYSLSDVVTFNTEEREAITRAFARFAARLHEDGFLHRDFSASNILFDNVGGRYRFQLIDTNSMKIGRAVSIEKGCKNLAQLIVGDDFFDLLATEYAAARHADPSMCQALIEKARQER